jgi:uncharacterized membrane protein HdeD (DUF308 family)
MCFVVRLVGRLLAIILGSVLIIAGLLLSATIIGSIVGIPLIVLGGLLVICALFSRRRRPFEPLRL